MKDRLLTMEDVKESWDAMHSTNIISVTHNGRYYIVTKEDGRAYTESPEEQGRSSGPRLLRAFSNRPEAERYCAALGVYVGEPLVLKSVGRGQIVAQAKRIRQGCRIEVCRMYENEWPQSVAELPLEITVH